MLNRFSTVVVAAALLAGAAIAQEPDAETYNAILKQTNPVQKLADLDAWTQKVPDTKFKTQRNYLYIDAYSRIGAMAAGGNATPDQLAAAQNADQMLIDKADTFFDPGMKLANATPEQWQQAKAAVLLAAHQSLIAIYAARKDTPNLQKEYIRMIEVNPNDARVAMLLAASIYSEGKVERRPDGMFQYARALSVTGPGALDPATKKQTEDFLTKSYKNYHGDTKGLDDLKAMAAKSTMPPADFHLESVTDISKKDIAAEEEFNKSHPEIISWRTVKSALTAPDGDGYFAKGMKGAEFPKTKAKVVAQPSPKELTVSIDNATPETAAVAEATLKLTDATFKGPVAAGTEVAFTGSPETFTKEPYMVVFEVEKANMEGVEMAPAVPTKKAVRKRKTQ